MEKPMKDEDVRAFEEYLSQQLELHVQNVTFKTAQGSGQPLNVSLAYLAGLGRSFPFTPGMKITAEVDESPRRIRKSLQEAFGLTASGRRPSASSAGETIAGLKIQESQQACCVLM